MPRSRLGDRREHVRFEVAGQLWAALDVATPVVVKNIGFGGALVETRLAPGLSSVRAVHMSLREHGPALSVVVRHLSPLSASADEDRYLVGLEFIHLTPSARSEVERWVREWGGEN